MSKANKLIEAIDKVYEPNEFLTISEEQQHHSVPDGVKAAARKGLEMRAKHKRGGIGPGQRMARKLTAGKVSTHDVKKIAAYHARHSKSPGERSHKDWGNASNPSNGYIAHQLWGGHAGEKWSKGHKATKD